MDRTLILAGAVVVSAAMVAGALLFGDRYEMESHTNGLTLRLDRLSGQLTACAPLQTQFACRKYPDVLRGSANPYEFPLPRQ